MSAHYREEWTEDFSFRFESLLETLLEQNHSGCGFPCPLRSHQSLLFLLREARGLSIEERRHLREENDEYQPEQVTDPNNNLRVLEDEPGYELNNNIEQLVVDDSE